MKRAGIFLALMGVLVLVFAGVATAAIINGNNQPNTLIGTPRHDVIHGYGGGDLIRGRGGEDDMFGGRGGDYIRAVDRREDDVSCGRGNDKVRANPGDDVNRANCERIIRAGIRVDDNDGGDD